MYDGIVVTAGGPKIPLALRKQLVRSGSLVMPVGAGRSQQHLIRVTRDSDTAYSQETLVVSTLCRSSVRKGGHQANANPCRWPKWLPR